MWYSTPSREEKVARLFSDGLGPVVAGSLGYLALSGKDGRDAAFDGAKALVVQGVVVTGIKKLIPIRRPYPNDYKFGTFPSGHTSTAFTMAGILGAAKPGAKTPAYVVASLVGWSRVKVRAHRWQDVAAGAVVGIVVANQFKPEKEVRGPFARLNLRF
ncbi:phosphatase PAP2 family protein [bacterium]|nr:MAG: phosphatase PAP2 family protein [bacterium]